MEETTTTKDKAESLKQPERKRAELFKLDLGHHRGVKQTQKERTSLPQSSVSKGIEGNRNR